MSESEKPQDAAPEAPWLVTWRSAAEKANAELKWKLDHAVELANERQAEINALNRRFRFPLLFFSYYPEDHCKCSGCCGLFPREAITEKDGALFCAGCVEESKLAEQVKNQAELIKTLESRNRVLVSQFGDQGKKCEFERIQLKAELAKAEAAIESWKRQIARTNELLDEQAETIARLEAGIQSKAEASFAAAPIEEAKPRGKFTSILQAMADREKTMQAAEADDQVTALRRECMALNQRVHDLEMMEATVYRTSQQVADLQSCIPAEPVACWYRDAVPQGWSSGWLLLSAGLKLVAFQNGHVRWCHPSNVTTTEPEFT